MHPPPARAIPGQLLTTGVMALPRLNESAIIPMGRNSGLTSVSSQPGPVQFCVPRVATANTLPAFGGSHCSGGSNRASAEGVLNLCPAATAACLHQEATGSIRPGNWVRARPESAIAARLESLDRV